MNESKGEREREGGGGEERANRTLGRLNRDIFSFTSEFSSYQTKVPF